LFVCLFVVVVVVVVVVDCVVVAVVAALLFETFFSRAAFLMDLGQEGGLSDKSLDSLLSEIPSAIRATRVFQCDTCPHRARHVWPCLDEVQLQVRKQSDSLPFRAFSFYFIPMHFFVFNLRIYD
jgi:hypothetical protein